MGALSISTSRKRLETELRAKAEQATELQRVGDFLELARVATELDELERQLEELERRGQS